MYEACVHGKYYSNDDGTSGGSWCCVFTFEDYRVNIIKYKIYKIKQQV